MSRAIFNPEKYDTDYFDYVTMDHVLEHIVHPLPFLQNVRRVLKPGGKLVAAFPNLKAFGRFFFGKYWNEWHLPFHRHFYTRRSLEILAKQAGYEIEMLKSASESSILLKNWARCFYIMFNEGQTGGEYSTVSLCNGEVFEADMKKKLSVKLFLFLKKIRFCCLSMRLADFFGMGNHNILLLRKNNS